MARFEFYDLPPDAKAKLVRLNAAVAGNHVLLAGLRFALLLRKANFNPNQPRAPRGSSDGGRWAGSGASGSDSTDPKEPSVRLPHVVPLHGIGGESLEEAPHIPKERPVDKAVRHKIIKTAAKWIAKIGLRGVPYVGEALLALDAAEWAAPYVRSYFDAPKSLEELQEGVLISEPGYETHHIVEQGPARQSNSIPSHLIDSKENLVRIPYLKHHEVTGWSNRPNEKFDGLSPREYLRDKDWDERMRVGLEGLRDAKVLKP